MRRAPAWMAIVAAWLIAPAAAQAAGVWVTLAAGLPGADTSTSNAEFYFDNPHAPNIAVNQLTGGVSAEAVTGGGNSFFGGAGVPVLLNVGSGSAYIASGSAPSAARTAGAGGGTPSSVAPTAGGSLPSDAALLGAALAEPENGTRTLTTTITDSLGNPLGSAAVNVPDGGWWVIGLGPDQRLPSEPTDDPDPIDPPPPVDPLPENPVPTPGPVTGSPVATPEPGTIALAAIGSGAMYMWRRARLRPAA